jgi:hypothetical protein
MNAISPLRVMNRVVNVRPIVSFASKWVGSGPNRLKMVRLWHELDNDSFEARSPVRTSIAD